MFWRRRREQELADAREEALRWYDRLGGQIANLSGGGEPAVKQALVDAGERYNAAGAQLDRADSPEAVRAGPGDRAGGPGLHPGGPGRHGPRPGSGPAAAGRRSAASARSPRTASSTCEGHRYRASPQPADGTPYYYPGGRIQGRPVPAGWYSEPWWKGALATGAGVFGGMLLFDALAGGFGDAGYGGYDQGYEQGYDQGRPARLGPRSARTAATAAATAATTAAAATMAVATTAAGICGGDFGGGDFGGGDF